MEQYHETNLAAQPQFTFSRSTQNIGLPINSRLINESRTSNPFLNNYQVNTAQYPQQNYYQSAVSASSRQPSFVDQSNAAPFTNNPAAGPSVSFGQQINKTKILLAQRGSQPGIKCRMVPVTQYVPVYEQYEKVESVPIQNQSLHQRIIQHEPEAFKERIVYDEGVEAFPTTLEVHEKVGNVGEAPIQNSSMRVVRVSQDPLVETVQGGWKSRIGASRASYSPPPPVPREEKACFSGWMLCLLGLIALAGLLAAILISKNSSQQQLSEQQSTTVAGTKVGASNGPSNVVSVVPLTNANITEVQGTTAVATPITVQPTPQQKVPVAPVVQSVVQPATSVAPTDISKVANPLSPTPIPTQVQPQKTGLVTVSPVIVNPSSTPADFSFSTSSSFSHVDQNAPAIPPSNGESKVAASLPSNSNQKVSAALPSTTPSSLSTQPTVVQPITQPSTIPPSTVSPLTTQPTKVPQSKPSSKTASIPNDSFTIAVPTDVPTITSPSSNSDFLPMVEILEGNKVSK